MYAFLSYQSEDQAVAGELKETLEGMGIEAFLAHQDIQVSHNWRNRLLEELRRVDLFVAILSERYLASAWCVQEAGIAAFRVNVGVVPLSIDSTTPPAFISHIQSTRITPGEIDEATLYPALATTDLPFVVDRIISRLRTAGSFRWAEDQFKLILPYLPMMSDDQKVELLNVSADNNQVHHANLCAKRYLPPLFDSHGVQLSDERRDLLKGVLAQYSD